MKQAVLLHGTDGSNTNYFWFSNTKDYLERNGYMVWWPMLPHTGKPELEESLGYIEQHAPALDEESIIIAHSSACPLALWFLENSMVVVKQVILVSGFYQPIDDANEGGISHLMLPEDGFDYDRIRTAAHEFVFINSDNDPWGCNDTQAQPVAEALGAKLVIAKGQGHMGSSSFNQPMTELPILKDVLQI